MSSSKYVNLHQHSEKSNRSMLDAYWKVEQIVARCKEIWYSAVAITDHGAVDAHIRLIRECKKNDLKPICGCEMYVTDDLDVMKKVRDKIIQKDKDEILTDENQEYQEDEKTQARMKNHFTVLAQNQEGLKALWWLVSDSYTEGFYFKPTTDWSRLIKHKENLFFGSACEIWPLWRLLDHYQYRSKLEIDALIKDEITSEFDKKESEISDIKKEIKNLRQEIKDLQKTKTLSSDKYEENSSKISKNLELINEIEEEYKYFESEVKEKHKDEIDKIHSSWMIKAREALKEKMLWFIEQFGDKFYVEMIPIPEDRARWKYLMIFEVAKEVGVMLVATNDSHYPKKEDSVYQDLLYTMNLYRSDSQVRFDDTNRSRYLPNNFYIHSYEEMTEKMRETYPEVSHEDIEEMITNSMKIVNQIDTVSEPEVNVVAYDDLENTEENHVNIYKKFQKMILDWWVFRWFDKLSPEESKKYNERVGRELDVILNKGYIDYFMIMADIMDWCEKGRPYIENFDKWWALNWHLQEKTKEEVYEDLKSKWMFDMREPIGTGIARWSAGGSLIAYLLRITNIDPMPESLLFERFIDYTRGNVYYHLDFETYTKKQFLKDYPEEDTHRLKELEDKFKPWVIEKIKELLKNDEWFDRLQVAREFWLLDHNQAFSREKEYFYTCLFKRSSLEIDEAKTNHTNSILSWITGITSEKPKWDYVVRLTDIPDIDSDFEDQRRDEVYRYLQNRYWFDNSARIATYTVIKAPSWLDRLSSIFDCDHQDIVKIKDFFDSYCEENWLVELNPKTIWDCFATETMQTWIQKYPWINYLPGLMWQTIASGMHAAWMVVLNTPLKEVCALYINKDKETWLNVPVICWDSIEGESLGLMKLDILGLNTVTNIKRVNELVAKRHSWDHHWQRIEGVFDDVKTKKLVRNADTTWLFQLEGKIMTHLSQVVKPDSFEEVSFVAAAWRPGPLQDGLEYGDIKFWRKDPYYYNNEIYKSITERWGGKIIYQEDLMKLCKLMCWYNDSEVWKVRKIVSKVQREEMKKLEPDFISRLQKYSWMSEEESKKLWDSVVNFGSYAFNKCLVQGEFINLLDSERKKIDLENNTKITLKELYELFQKWEKFFVPSYNEKTKTIENDEIIDVFKSWTKEVYEVELENGITIKCTKDHPFLTKKWWLSLEDIISQDLDVLQLSENK